MNALEQVRHRSATQGRFKRHPRWARFGFARRVLELEAIRSYGKCREDVELLERHVDRRWMRMRIEAAVFEGNGGPWVQARLGEHAESERCDVAKGLLQLLEHAPAVLREGALPVLSRTFQHGSRASKAPEGWGGRRP